MRKPQLGLRNVRRGAMAKRLYRKVRPSENHGEVIAVWGLGWVLWLFLAVFSAFFIGFGWFIYVDSGAQAPADTYVILGGIILLAAYAGLWPRVWLTRDFLLVRDFWFLLEIPLVEIEDVRPDLLTTFLEVDLDDGDSRSLFAVQSGALPQLLKIKTRARRIGAVILEAVAAAKKARGED